MSTLDENIGILCVDDEIEVLNGLQLSLRKLGGVSLAVGGQEGLAWIAAHPAPAVVISDMRMPGMDGAQFLAEVRKLSPDSTRILLTGQADLTSAIAAVNHGQIFRFLTKPCPKPELTAAIESAIEQHRLVTSEKVLLEQTLKGCTQALVDLLALADPGGFGRAQRIRHRAAGLSQELGMVPSWQLDIAGLLSHIGWITLSPELTEKVVLGGALSAEEKDKLARLPAVSIKLLEKIPRLEEVLGILRASLPDAEYGVADGPGCQGGKVLRLASELEALPGDAAAESPEARSILAKWTSLDPKLAGAARVVIEKSSLSRKPLAVSISDLRVGMVLAKEIRAKSGMLLVGNGFCVTEGLLEKLGNFERGSLNEPILVQPPKGDARLAP